MNYSSFIFQLQICQIMEIDDVKLDTTMAKLDINIFTIRERCFLKEYTDIMKTITDALNNLQKDKCPYDVVLPTSFYTLEKLNDIKTDNKLMHCKPLLSAVIAGFNKRFSGIMDLNSKTAIPSLIAAITHPFFKLRWLNPDILTAELMEKIKAILAYAADEITLVQLENKARNDSDKDKSGHNYEASINRTVDKSFQYKFYLLSERQQNRSMDIDEHAKNYSEISKYLIHPHSEAISDVKQLHSFPVVMNLFRKFNVILPSEADIERLFSFAGRLT